MSNKLLKDGMLLMVAKFFSIASGLVTAMFIARYYGVNLYGQYTTALTFSTFILTFTDLGLDTFMLKECSRDKKNLSKYYSNILLLKLIILAFSVGIILVLANVLGYDSEVIKLIIILIPNTIIAYIISTFFVVMQIKNLLSTNAKIQIIQSLCLIIVAFLIMILKLDIYIYALLQSLVSILLLIIYIIIIPVKFKPLFKYSKFLVKGSIVFGISSLLYIVYYKIDTVMISLIRGTYEVGVYESAYKIINIIISMIAILDNLFMPKFFKLYKENKDKMLLLFEVLFKYGIIFGIPFSVILMVMSKYIINILYGNQYSDAIIILEILAWCICIRLMAAIVGFVITASDNMKSKIKFQAYFAVANLALNAILIPRLGAKGAAIATLITESLVLVKYYLFVKRKFNAAINFEFILKGLIANGILIGILHNISINNFIIMGMVSSILALIILLLLFKKEMNSIVKILINNIKIGKK